jgi:UDP-glucuronate decarboxylase
MASKREVSGPINLGNPGEFTVMALAQTIIELTGSKSRIVHRALPPDDPRQRQPDIAQAQTMLGWSPSVSLRQGLERTIPYFETLLRSVPALQHLEGTEHGDR